MTRFATLNAETISVLCPYCGEPQPCRRDGSDLWTPQDLKVRATDTKTTCQFCGEEFKIIAHKKAHIQYEE